MTIIKKKNGLGIRINAISTPFGGISWGYTEKEKQEDYEAVQLLFIFLEGKRLITLPFSRNIDVPFDKDMEWCSLSAIDLKNNIFCILSKYKLPSDVINELQSMINHCNSLLEGMASLDSKKVIINNNYNKLQKHDDFLNMIDNFKKNIFYHIKFLSEKYSIEFKAM